LGIKILIYRSESLNPLELIIRNLTETMSDEVFMMRIRRSNVLEDALVNARRKSFHPYKKLIVSV